MSGAMADSAPPVGPPQLRPEAPERVRPKAWRSWLSVIIVFLGVAALTATAASDWGYRPSRGGAAYLPSDGFRELQGPSPDRPASQGRIRESAIISAPQVRRAVPTAVRDFAVSTGVELEIVPWQLWWRSTVTEIGDAASTSELYSYSPGLGLVEVLTWDDRTAETFLPALPILPASGDLGATWTAKGRVTSLGYDPVSYTLEGSFRSATDPGHAGRSCAVSRIELTRGDQPTEIERLVFCPGAGLVDRSRSESVHGASTLPVLPRPSAERPPDPTWSPQAWVLRDRAVASARWPGAADLQPIAVKDDSAVTASGTLVVRRGDDFDVSGLRPRGTRYVLDWTARPGGRILSITAVGDLVVAVTGERRLVAYDDRGRFVWEQRLPEVSHVAASPLGRGRLLVITKTGHVEVRRTATGAVVWAADLQGAPTGEPAVDEASGRFYVADDAGVVTAFSPDGPAPLWTAEVDGRRFTMAATRTGVVINGNGMVTLLEDGVRRWALRVPSGGEVVVFADVVAVVEGEAPSAVRVFDLTDGRPRWSVPAVIAMTATTDTMIMAVDGALIAVDRAGVTQARVEVPVMNLEASLHPVRTSSGDGVWLWWSRADRLVLWSPGP